MSGDNRIGVNAIQGIFRANAARRLTSEGNAPVRAPINTYTAAEPAPAARLIGMASDLADQGPPIDGDRVQALKTAISDGSYSVHPDKIAASMTRFFGRDS